MKKVKLIQRIANNPRDVRFSDFTKAMAQCGWTLRPGKGSHQIWTHEDRGFIPAQSLPNGKAKQYQVEAFLKWLDERGLIQ